MGNYLVCVNSWGERWGDGGTFKMQFPGRGHGERSRSELLFKIGGTENLSILVANVLVVNVLDVNRPPSVLQCSVKKYPLRSTQCQKVRPSLHIVSYTRSPCVSRLPARAGGLQRRVGRQERSGHGERSRSY